jgi:hypothetical protein
MFSSACFTTLKICLFSYGVAAFSIHSAMKDVNHEEQHALAKNSQWSSQFILCSWVHLEILKMDILSTSTFTFLFFEESLGC